MHDLLVVCCFIGVEAAMRQVEHWFEGRFVALRNLHHGIFVAWVIHPSIASGFGEWVMHLLPKLVG